MLERGRPASSTSTSTPPPTSEIHPGARAPIVVLARELSTAEAYVAELVSRGHRAVAARRGAELPGDALHGVAIVVDADGLPLDELLKSGTLDVPSIPDPGDGAPPLESVARLAYEEAERRYIVRALARFDGNRTRAARMLKVSRSTLWQKLRRYGLEEATRGSGAPKEVTSPPGS
jgi:DNA-binding NtrC family response regulator